MCAMAHKLRKAAHKTFYLLRAVRCHAFFLGVIPGDLERARKSAGARKKQPSAKRESADGVNAYMRVCV